MSYQWYPQYSIDKVSEDKVRGGKDREEKDKEEPAAPLSVPDQVVESFDLFWNEYPRQHDRSETFSVFRDVLSSGTDPVAIMDGLERYLLYIRTEKIDTRYIMYPVTWLKKKCWLETYPVSKELTTKDLETYVDFTNIISKGSDDPHE